MSDATDAYPELIRLNAQYCHRIDDGELDALLELFDADATIDFAGRRSTGHDQLRQFFTGIQAATAGGRHLCANFDFDVHGTSATGVLDFLLMRTNGDPPMLGRYQDAYRNSDGRWSFASRTIIPAG
jgi:hypothetical protein